MAGRSAPAWRRVIGSVDLDFDAIDPALDLESWEPIFPARRGKRFPGAPSGSHLLHAFDGIDPDDVRCVILGQDPYPEPGFSTGRAFEAGNVAAWRELDKMFSRSVRAFIQLIVAARTGDDRYSGSFANWPATLDAIETGVVAFEAPGELAGRWIDQGVLLLNSSLTLSRFRVDADPHQTRGHLPLWRPLISAVLRSLARSGRPVVFIGFGHVAAAALAEAEIDAAIVREHPANADAVLALDNPFRLANAALAAAGGPPIAW